MKKICLLDGSGFIFRAFHALPPLVSPQGIPVNAVYGFIKSVMLIQESKDVDYLAVIFDASRHTFRQRIYQEYKAHRPPTPEDLIPQFKIIRQAVKALNIACIEKDDFEADDIIATYATQATSLGLEVEIISSDKDLMQLVDDSKNIHMYDPFKRKKITEKEVDEKFGVIPSKVIFVQALIGDSADNVPGVKGIGPKTASELINTFGNLDNIYNNLNSISRATLKEKLINDKTLAYTSLELVTLKRDINLDDSLEVLRVQETNPQDLCTFLQSLSFNSLASKVASKYKINLSPMTPALQITDSNLNESTPKGFPIQERTNVIIESTSSLEAMVKNLSDNRIVPILATIDELGNIINFSFFDIKKNTNYSIQQVRASKQANLLDESNIIQEQQLLLCVQNILSSHSIKKIFYDAKKFMHCASKYNVQINSFDDIAVMSYLVDGIATQTHPLVELVKKHLLLDKLLDDKNIQPCFLLELFNIYKYLLVNIQSTYLYTIFDKPLIEVLFVMETNGILVDKQVLNNLSNEFNQDLLALEAEIYHEVGAEFNIGSPKQIGEILFETLQIKGKKNKTGTWKTDVTALENLESEGIKIASLILQWRQIAKLKNTYTDKLPTKIKPITGRVHTSFLQCSTNTSRLSSIEPNLQNIPIKSIKGKNIRKAFIARSSYKLISLDYSQIELKVLTSIAKVHNLISAFKNHEDIHTKTASEIFNLPINQITSNLRRKAKAINFGIIYGQGAYGLSSSLKIDKAEAKTYIDTYFTKYPEIKQYMENTVTFAKQHGYVLTLFNRRCFIDNINNTNGTLRSFAERAAINAVIQGTTADLMRKALVDIHNFINKNHYNATILLQIHDEILLEVHKDIADSLAPQIKYIMENCVKLGINLDVEYTIADNWFDAHT